MCLPCLRGIRLIYHVFTCYTTFLTWCNIFSCYNIWLYQINEVCVCCTMFSPDVWCFSPETMLSPVTLYGRAWFLRYSPAAPCFCLLFDVFHLKQCFHLLHCMVLPDLWGIRLLYHVCPVVTFSMFLLLYVFTYCLMLLPVDPYFACFTMFLRECFHFHAVTSSSSRPIVCNVSTCISMFSPGLPCNDDLIWYILTIFCLFCYVSVWMLSISLPVEWPKASIPPILPCCWYCFTMFDLFSFVLAYFAMFLPCISMIFTWLAM